jgi:hypothetical protein
MARSRERQRKNRRLKAELHSVDRFNGSRISDPTAYQAQKRMIISQFDHGKRR